MHDDLPHGGLIRKLWIGEAERYRDHLLRLDPISRRNRFAGTVSDDFVRRYADIALGIDAVIHGFFVDGRPARRSRAASRSASRFRTKPSSRSRSRKPGRATASVRRCSDGHCSPRAIAA